MAGMDSKVQRLIAEAFGIGIGAPILQAIARLMLRKPNATWNTFFLGLATWTFAAAAVFTVRYLWHKRASRRLGNAAKAHRT
jgi:hypothetical protein